MSSDSFRGKDVVAPWYPSNIEEARTLMGYALATESTVQKMYGAGPPVLGCRPTTRLYSKILRAFEEDGGASRNSPA